MILKFRTILTIQISTSICRPLFVNAGIFSGAASRHRRLTRRSVTYLPVLITVTATSGVVYRLYEHLVTARRKIYRMNFCTPADCFSFFQPYFIAFSAACFRYGVLTITLYTSLPSFPLLRTTVSCSLPTFNPSCLEAALAGLLYCGKPYLNVTCFSLPSANNFRSSFAAKGDLTRHEIWSLVLRPKA